MQDVCKPILKWVGGKTQILPLLLQQVPSEFENYHEVFVGGGSVLLGILSWSRQNKIKIRGKVFAYDSNEPLIYLYKNIQYRHHSLFTEVETLASQYRSCDGTVVNRSPKDLADACTSKESFYYWIRQQYNKLSSEDKKTVQGSAMFLFLNKTCFRGLFRVGPNGFNVPFGNYKNPEIVNKDHLNQLHDLIQPVSFQVSSFEQSIPMATANDYVYLDPPYAPENESSFVGYTRNGFDAHAHQTLFEAIRTNLHDNIKMMMSNADVPLTRKAFPDSQYNVISISCKRTINSKNPTAKTNEILVKNY